ncbi:MAG: hypothetical protein HN348_19900 [Proteobacteria bacterium]|nr:hypothetical protein [Pseudomonadota bacterium]
MLAILSIGLALAKDVESAETDAHAVQVIVESEVFDEVIADLVVATGRPVADFVPTPVAEVVQGIEPFLVQSHTEPCSDSIVSGASFNEVVKALQGAVDYDELERARGLAQEATAALGCLDEFLDAQRVARLHFLSGVAAVGEGNGEAAAIAFRRARVFVPDLTWDENYPPDGRLVFDAIAAESVETVELNILPAPQDSIRLDGHVVDTATLNVSKGLHYFQFGTESVSTHAVRLEQDDVLVVPSAYDAEILEWIGDDSQQQRLTDLLQRRFGEEKSIYVSHEGDHWLLNLTEGSWSPLERRRRSGGKKAPVALIVGGAGGAVFLGGAIVGIAGLTRGLQVKNGVETWKDYESAQGPYGAARNQLVAGEVLAAFGAATLGTGLTLHFVMGK